MGPVFARLSVSALCTRFSTARKQHPPSRAPITRYLEHLMAPVPSDTQKVRQKKSNSRVTPPRLDIAYIPKDTGWHFWEGQQKNANYRERQEVKQPGKER
jgi:hypothetical protein